VIGDLLELVWVVPIVALLVTITFSLCVLGATRASDERRNGNAGTLAAIAWMALAIVAGIFGVAELVAGIAVIIGG
jgi:hypothetical protein